MGGVFSCSKMFNKVYMAIFSLEEAQFINSVIIVFLFFYYLLLLFFFSAKKVILEIKNCVSRLKDTIFLHPNSKAYFNMIIKCSCVLLH